MTGNTANTSVWTGADVFYAPLGTVAPTDLTTDWGASWLPLGLLNGDDGVTEARSQTTTMNYAWGQILYRRTLTQQQRTIAFTALEDNDNVYKLLNPGSTATSALGVRTRTDMVPVAGTYFTLGVELRDGTKSKRKIWDKAEVETVANIVSTESKPETYNVTCIVYPDEDGTLATIIETDPTYVTP